MNVNLKIIFRKLVPLRIRKIIFSFKAIETLKKEITILKQEVLYFKVLHYFEYNPSDEYVSEINYLKNIGKIIPFPYRQIKPIGTVEGGIDNERKMPYILHQDKKLFFPHSWSVNDARQVYINYIATENILGGAYTEKAPHQYLTETFDVKEDDIVMDVGAAEGLFLLDVIDKVRKAYLFEPNPEWLGPLKATFEPYMHKVVIIEKYATNKDSPTEIKLDSCIKENTEGIFIKLDVEGYEQLVLSGAEKLLAEKNNVRVVCCTYHKNDDAQQLKNFFEGKGFHTEFSDGYILFPYDEKIKPPYFRKGMIRAFKLKPL